jgi:putative endonuclease
VKDPERPAGASSAAGSPGGLSSPDARRKLGSRGEKAVLEWYRGRGYRLLASNWRCGEGEIDLVLDGPSGESFVFCEVKTRNSTRFGTGFEAVTAIKQRRLRRLASRWLAENRSRTSGSSARFREIRFDVAAVSNDGQGLVVDVREAAF